MKFKIDENLPVEIADILESASYDAVSVTDIQDILDLGVYLTTTQNRVHISPHQKRLI